MDFNDFSLPSEVESIPYLSQVQGGGRWNPQSITSWSEVQVITRACNWHLQCGPGVGGSLVGLSPQLVESDTLSGWTVSELS